MERAIDINLPEDAARMRSNRIQFTEKILTMAVSLSISLKELLHVPNSSREQQCRRARLEGRVEGRETG